MSRNRIIYQSLALYVGPTPSTGAHLPSTTPQLQRVISADLSVDRPTEDVVVLGGLAAVEKLTVESPTVSLDFSYYTVDAINDRNIGMNTNGGITCLANILDKSEDDKNYFLAIADEGLDAVGEAVADLAVIGVGNGFLASWSTEGSVGGFPTTNVSIEGLNIRGYADAVAENIPAVDPTTGLDISDTFTLADPTGQSGAAQPSAIQRGDITVDLANATGLFQNFSDICAQSYNISFDLAREPQQCLGSRFATTREPTFPVDVTCTVELLGKDVIEGNLADLLCNDVASNIVIGLQQPDCAGTGRITMQYTMNNFRLESQNWTNSVGPAQTVSVTWVGQVAAASDTANGLFMSGVTGYTGGLALPIL
jgi:hypothetical protein